MTTTEIRDARLASTPSWPFRRERPSDIQWTIQRQGIQLHYAAPGASIFFPTLKEYVDELFLVVFVGKNCSKVSTSLVMTISTCVFQAEPVLSILLCCSPTGTASGSREGQFLNSIFSLITWSRMDFVPVAVPMIGSPESDISANADGYGRSSCCEGCTILSVDSSLMTANPFWASSADDFSLQRVVRTFSMLRKMVEMESIQPL